MAIFTKVQYFAYVKESVVEKKPKLTNLRASFFLQFSTEFINFTLTHNDALRLLLKVIVLRCLTRVMRHF